MTFSFIEGKNQWKGSDRYKRQHKSISLGWYRYNANFLNYAYMIGHEPPDCLVCQKPLLTLICSLYLDILADIL